MDVVLVPAARIGVEPLASRPNLVAEDDVLDLRFVDEVVEVRASCAVVPSSGGRDPQVVGTSRIHGMIRRSPGGEPGCGVIGTEVREAEMSATRERFPERFDERRVALL